MNAFFPGSIKVCLFDRERTATDKSSIWQLGIGMELVALNNFEPCKTLVVAPVTHLSAFSTGFQNQQVVLCLLGFKPVLI